MREAGEVLPDELEARLNVVSAASEDRDFDARSWFWMILLGLVIPVGLIVAGWLYGPGAR